MKKIVIPKLALFVKFIDEAIICPALKKAESSKAFKELSAKDKVVGEDLAASISNEFRISILRSLLVNATSTPPKPIDRVLASEIFGEVLNFSEDSLLENCMENEVESDTADVMFSTYTNSLTSELTDTKIFDGFAVPLMEMVYEPLSAVLKNGDIIGFNVDLSFMLDMAYASGEKSADAVTVTGFKLSDVDVASRAENISHEEFKSMLCNHAIYDVMSCNVAIVNGKMVCPYTYKITDPINTVVFGTVEI